MKTLFINSLTIIMLFFSINALTNESRIKNIVEFTKYTDKNDLLKLLTQLQTEKILLQSTISEHGLKCQSVLDSCKNKFSQPGCDMTHNIKKQELEETIKVTEQTINDNKDILVDIDKIVQSTQKDCEEIEKFYHSSNEKLFQDNKRILEIKKKIKGRLNNIRSEQDKRNKLLSKSKQSSQMNRTNTTLNSNSKVIQMKKSGNHSNLTQNNTNTSLNKKIVKLAISPSNNITSNNIQIKNKTLKNETAVIQKNNTMNSGIKKNISILNTSLLDLEEEEEDKGFLSNIFEKITGIFSLIQLKQTDNNDVESFTFTQLETKLEKMLTPAQQINFLITTLHEFNIVLKSLKESQHTLKQSYKESKASCTKRITSYERKRKYSYDMMVESKINLEIYKKKLTIQDSKLRLCGIQANDLVLCNKMNKYCGKYQEEYKAEERELDDLIMFFKTFIEKYN